MRLLPLFLAFLMLICAIIASSQSVPPGAPLPRIDAPPGIFLPRTPEQGATLSRTRVDPVELKTEAEELLRLSQSIQTEIEQFNRGVLNKDAIGKLKRMEKLSKRLRGQMSQ